MILLLIFLIIVNIIHTIYSQTNFPLLKFDGFSWAENLVFDGLGGLFVSETIRGELWKIQICANNTMYCGSIYLKDEKIMKIGGLSVTNNGEYLFAGVTFNDNTYGIISITTTNANGKYNILIKNLNKQPNGMAFDEYNNILYCTDEGEGNHGKGTLLGVDIITKNKIIIKNDIPSADGCWFDIENNLLFVGELLSMKIMVFEISNGIAKYINEYEGLHSSDFLSMLDDFTVYKSNNILENTVLIGADWTGKQIKLFQLNGKNIKSISTPGIEMYQPTSIRWGKGYGFDPNSIYVTEGGGMTKQQTNRRVFQVKMY